MLGRFRTRETLLLLVAGLALVEGACRLFALSMPWRIALAAGFLLFAYIPLAVRMQDRLLERALATGRYDSALRIASAIRDSARNALPRSLADFDVGLVHLARGAPDDALRCFRRMEKHRLKSQTRLLVDVHEALARQRSAPSVESAKVLQEAALEAEKVFGEDPALLSARAEGLLGDADPAAARAVLTKSLERDADPLDPSPGERHVLFARAALLTGARDAAVRSLTIAAALRPDTPFVREARAELKRLESSTS